MALRDFQTALGRMIQARRAEDPLQGLALTPEERARLTALTASVGFHFTVSIQRSWCTGRAAMSAHLTLSLLPEDQRTRLLEESTPSPSSNSSAATCPPPPMNRPSAASSRQPCAPVREPMSLLRRTSANGTHLGACCAGDALPAWCAFMPSRMPCSARYYNRSRCRPSRRTLWSCSSDRVWNGYAARHRRTKCVCGSAWLRRSA